MKLTDENGKEYEFNIHELDPDMIGALMPISPKTKRIDMSVCIESGIDCEVSNTGKSWRIFKIKEINDSANHKYINDLSNNLAWRHCRPRMSTESSPHIHASPTGWDKCPIPEGFKIKFYSIGRMSDSDTELYDTFDWNKIKMFEITGYADGYEGHE